jgi:hypothetical protein
VLAFPLILPGFIDGVVSVLLGKLFPVTWLDRRLARKDYERLSAEVQRKLQFLFTEYGGRVVPNDREYPLVFDYAVVTVAVGKLRLGLSEAGTNSEWMSRPNMRPQRGKRSGPFSRLSPNRESFEVGPSTSGSKISEGS